jgi:hypothetical protein
MEETLKPLRQRPMGARDMTSLALAYADDPLPAALPAVRAAHLPGGRAQL